jgi:hypothetical protein
VVLEEIEIAMLFIQPARTRGDGGYQSLMVGLQNKTDRATGAISLNSQDIERINRYAFKYRKGGWEDRLKSIFTRSLGPRLEG